MTKWVIRAWSEDGSIQEGEYDRFSAVGALNEFYKEFPFDVGNWTNIDIDRVEDGE